MKNVTITLDEKLARWARVEAAKAGKSLSGWIRDRLGEIESKQTGQREALQRFLSAPDLPGVTADLPNREELYAERLFHRHERPALREGSDRADEAGKSHRVARRSRR